MTIQKVCFRKTDFSQYISLNIRDKMSGIVLKDLSHRNDYFDIHFFKIGWKMNKLGPKNEFGEC